MCLATTRLQACTPLVVLRQLASLWAETPSFSLGRFFPLWATDPPIYRPVLTCVGHFDPAARGLLSEARTSG